MIMDKWPLWKFFPDRNDLCKEFSTSRFGVSEGTHWLNENIEKIKNIDTVKFLQLCKVTLNQSTYFY